MASQILSCLAINTSAKANDQDQEDQDLVFSSIRHNDPLSVNFDTQIDTLSWVSGSKSTA